MTYKYRLLIILMFACVSTHQGCKDDDSPSSTDSDSDTNTDSDSDTDSGPDPSGFKINVELSTKIGAVAIVRWSVGLDPIDNAFIEFGPTTEYGMIAPVDLEEPEFRTLLLGMKPSSKYHFRITAGDGEKTLTSSSNTVETGPVSNFLPQYVIDPPSASQLAGGFTVSCFYLNSQPFIMDADGDYVWWADPGTPPCSRARMSYDGKYMWSRDVNVRDNEGYLARISMDGLDVEVIPTPHTHHDFAVLPDGSLGLIYFDGGDPVCDDIRERSPDGTTTQIFHLADVITVPDEDDGCHSNSIHYHEADDSYTISVLGNNQYVKVTRSGELVWILGGAESTFKGASWYRQHGHQILDDGNILIFNNRDTDEPAMALEYSLNEDTWQASRIWEFTGDNASPIFGDVQRLPNGNTLVSYSAAGVFSEINTKGDLLRKTSFDLGGGFGYVVWRESLYGPPPKSSSE